MINQFDALNEELQRRRDECIQLKTLLLAKHRMSTRVGGELMSPPNGAVSEGGCSSSDAGMGADTTNADINSINTEGNEFEVGYNTQKILNRILENQMNEAKRSFDAEKCLLMKEIKQLRDDNERQQDLLMQNLSPESLADATFKNEIMKLTDQNLVCFIIIIISFVCHIEKTKNMLFKIKFFPNQNLNSYRKSIF